MHRIGNVLLQGFRAWTEQLHGCAGYASFQSQPANMMLITAFGTARITSMFRSMCKSCCSSIILFFNHNELNLDWAAQDVGQAAVPQGAGMDLAADIGGLLTSARAGCSSSDVRLHLRGPEDSATTSIPVHRYCSRLLTAAVSLLSIFWEISATFGMSGMLFCSASLKRICHQHFHMQPLAT